MSQSTMRTWIDIPNGVLQYILWQEMTKQLKIFQLFEYNVFGMVWYGMGDCQYIPLEGLYHNYPQKTICANVLVSSCTIPGLLRRWEDRTCYLDSHRRRKLEIWTWSVEVYYLAFYSYCIGWLIRQSPVTVFLLLTFFKFLKAAFACWFILAVSFPIIHYS